MNPKVDKGAGRGLGWYDRAEAILKDDFWTKCYHYTSDICANTDLKGFLQTVSDWEQELRVHFAEYQLEGVYGWAIGLNFNEFIYTDDLDDNLTEYLIKIIILDYYYSYPEDKTSDLRSIYGKYHEYTEQRNCFTPFFDDIDGIESFTYIDEEAFFREMADYMEKSYKEFNRLNQQNPARKDYSLIVGPQYKKVEDLLDYIRSIQGKKRFAKINEHGNDVYVTYLLKTQDRVYTVRIGDFL